MGQLESEYALKLKKTDIDSDRMVVHIKGAKGKKDRYTVLSQNVLEILRDYYKRYKPNEYLFEGQNGGKYSNESAGQVFKRALKKAKINKYTTLHTLRHSFACNPFAGRGGWHCSYSKTVGT